MHVAYAVASGFYLLRAVVLGYLLASGTYDAKFFTYINYGMFTLVLGLYLLACWSVAAYQLWCAMLLPYIWNTTSFVALAIIVIVQANDGVFLRTTVYNNGTNAVATIHTGDWLLHQLPLVELLFFNDTATTEIYTAFHVLWRSLTPGGRIGYTLYFLLCGFAVLTLYMINIDWTVNYPTEIPTLFTWALTVVLSLLLQLFLFAYLYNSVPSYLTAYTPMLQKHLFN
jgi:hypothetical protein